MNDEEWKTQNVEDVKRKVKKKVKAHLGVVDVPGGQCLCGSC
jgi:hypothetical protein